MPRERIELLPFGPPGKSLFGIYHAPRAGFTRRCGAVLCYPMGQEYIRSHRAYRQLAARLAMAGFPVLRFDFYGCGDASGDCEEGRISQWLSDISASVAAIRRRSGFVDVCLVGLRLGASLAMMAGAERGDIGAMVLWDPVVNGTTYVEELMALHREQLGLYLRKRPRHTQQDHEVEILGFPLTKPLIADLEQMDLLTIPRRPATNVLLIESSKVGASPLRKHLATIDAQVDYRHIASPQVWIADMNLNTGLVPIQVLQAAVAWLSERPS